LRTGTTTGAKRLLTDIREMAPGIGSRALEIEAARQIPLDLMLALKSMGAFRMLVPQSHGGLELDLPTALELIGEFGKIDGSVGWTVMIGSGNDLLAALLPRATYEQVYQNGPDTFVAGSAQPVGTAEQAAGGWLVNGRWPFATGCQHAEWIYGFCVMKAAGFPLPGSAGTEGPPLVRGFFLPARNWHIEDTWHAAGLKGSGSHHISLRDMWVPAANFFDIWSGIPCVAGPLYQAVPQLLPLFHGTISVAIAERALDELVELANTGRRQLRAAAPMRDSEVFQFELGRVAADVRAARAFLQTHAASLWRDALAGTLKDEAHFTQATQTAIWLVTTCVRATDACSMLGGASTLYESSPLQRRMRDLHAAALHAIAHQRHYANAGKLLLEKSTVNHTIGAAEC
jgi:alkylation response protein AidB-like acyl-CoA dehydrogenase